MAKSLVLVFGAALLVAVVGCKNDGGDSMGSMKMDGDKATGTSSPATMPTKYTCTMHPEVMSDMQGKCPKCGMALVAKK